MVHDRRLKLSQPRRLQECVLSFRIDPLDAASDAALRDLQREKLEQPFKLCGGIVQE